jgi:hypothetical protein
MGYQDGRRTGRGDYDDGSRYGATAHRDRSRDYGGNPGGSRVRPAGYDYDDRGFLDRAGDEVRSWFGDEEAERRRDYDDYMNRRYGDPRDQSSRIGFISSGPGGYMPGRGYAPYTGQDSGQVSSDYGRSDVYARQHDRNYQAWREERLAELDRDYAEYQQEHRSRFDNEFGSWRTRRNDQRTALGQVREHMDVVGSDGAHVGTVDKAAGDRIILTKSDTDAGGEHHSIPSRWIASVVGQTVTLEKTADQAKDEWRVEKERQALFGDRQRSDRFTRQY